MVTPHPKVYALLDDVIQSAADAKAAARRGDDQLFDVMCRRAMQCSDLARWWLSHPKIMEDQEERAARERAGGK